MNNVLQTANGSIFPSLLWDDWPLDRLLQPGGIQTASAVKQKQRQASIAADIAEHPDKYVVAMDVPGLRHEDIDLSLDNNVLTIQVQRPGPAEQKEVQYLHRGRWHGSTTQTLTLPEAATDDVDATLKDGVLTISVKKQPEKQARKITIKTEQ